MSRTILYSMQKSSKGGILKCSGWIGGVTNDIVYLFCHFLGNILINFFWKCDDQCKGYKAKHMYTYHLDIL